MENRAETDDDADRIADLIAGAELDTAISV
jgi:hypothetical protein